MSAADELRIRAKAADARLNPGRTEPPPEPEGELLSECTLGRGRVLRIAIEEGRRPGDGAFVSMRAWAEGYPTRSQVSFRCENLPGVAMAIADAMDKIESPRAAAPEEASNNALSPRWGR